MQLNLFRLKLAKLKYLGKSVYVIITDEMLQPCFHWNFVEKMC